MQTETSAELFNGSDETEKRSFQHCSRGRSSHSLHTETLRLIISENYLKWNESVFTVKYDQDREEQPDRVVEMWPRTRSDMRAEATLPVPLHCCQGEQISGGVR